MVKKVQLTDEMKIKLKGHLGFDVSAYFKYVLKVFREKNEDGEYNIPKELWPVFTLKSLDGLEVAKKEDAAGYSTLDDSGDGIKLHMQTGSSRIATLEKGIISVRDYYFEDGSIITFNDNIITLIDNDGKTTSRKGTIRDVIVHLPINVQIELQNAINERSTLTEEELQGL